MPYRETDAPARTAASLNVTQRLEEAKRLAASTRLQGERGDNVVPWPALGTAPHGGQLDPPIAAEALQHFAAAAEAEGVEGIAGPLLRAFRALERGHDRPEGGPGRQGRGIEASTRTGLRTR